MRWFTFVYFVLFVLLILKLFLETEHDVGSLFAAFNAGLMCAILLERLTEKEKNYEK